MAYPPDVLTRVCAVTSPPSIESSGEPIPGNARIIVSSNDGPLINIVSGITVWQDPKVFGGFSVTLPRTDQTTIWRDVSGRPITTNPTHTYRLALEVKNVITLVWECIRVWPDLAVPAGAGALDLDTAYDTSLTPYTITG